MMSLFYKTVGTDGRGMFVYYPGECSRTPFKRSAITLLLDTCSESDVNNVLYGKGFAEFANRNDVILSFPVPPSLGWNFSMEDGVEDDVSDFALFQTAIMSRDETPLETDAKGIPTVRAMLRSWHPMNDARYVVGVGSGASMAFTLGARFPDNIAGILTIGGELCVEAFEKAVYSPVPVSMISGGKRAADYFIRANEAKKTEENRRRAVYKNPVNPLQCAVLVGEGADMMADRCTTIDSLNADLMQKVWDRMFSAVRRVNTGAHGDCEPRMSLSRSGIEFTIDDSCLDGTPHTWFTHVPAFIKRKPDARYPLMFFFHGGSDNPAEAAEMSKFHEIGDIEGFITIYPWGTNRCSWNSDMDPTREDDVAFIAALIEYATRKYPVDPGRVYLSGFSNGAAMAQAFALAHPELVAAICPIDSNWPGDRFRPSAVDWREVRPFAIGMRLKIDRDWRIPVWYTYGSREPAYPVYYGSTQQHQYDFWKAYNNIEVRPTPSLDRPDPCGCGVPGDESETIAPSKVHPRHEYDVQRFFSRDKPSLNLYNFVAMRDKGHDVAPMDAYLGWAYVSQFRRSVDGALELTGNDEHARSDAHVTRYSR
jgi:Poly(3-hydroxybutyrate) depolymerase